MQQRKTVGKREFIQHTSRYIKWVQEKGKELVITHQNHPEILLIKIKQKKLSDLQGLVNVKIQGDINAHVLPGYDEW